MLKIIEFIKNNENWKELLEKEPYNLIIRIEDDLALFYYHLRESDFNEKIVRESRGLIINTKTLDIVCYPFEKFWNVQESFASEIDWNSAKVLEKLDGSMIKLWFYNDRWRVSTSKTIDSKNASLDTLTPEINNFLELFELAVKNNNLNIEKLNKDYTYIFELVSPYNRIVINYDKADLYHLGTKNNKTLEELDIDIGIKKPEEYNLNSLEEVMKVAKTLPHSKEGYVVVDEHWNRVKIKSPAYVAVHHLASNGVVSKDRILVLVKQNEQSEFLGYFPEYTDDFKMVEDKYNKYIELLNKLLKDFELKKHLDRREYAKWAKETVNSHLAFLLLDGKFSKDTIGDYLDKYLSYDVLEKM